MTAATVHVRVLAVSGQLADLAVEGHAEPWQVYVADIVVATGCPALSLPGREFHATLTDSLDGPQIRNWTEIG